MATQPAPAPTQPTAWQTGAPPGAMPTANPMATHVKVVAVLEIVWGALAAIGALFLLFIGSVGAAILRSAQSDGAPGWLAGAAGGLFLILAVVVGALATLAILGGTKLMAHKRSGKAITFVVAILSLLSFPIGTAYGIYALIILTREDTDRLLVD